MALFHRKRTETADRAAHGGTAAVLEADPALAALCDPRDVRPPSPAAKAKYNILSFCPRSGIYGSAPGTS